nr:hypothetical protein [Candidatus Freyarchaeota archaeon]
MLAKDTLMFEFMTYGYSGILNALVKLGLNMPLVARTAAHDMKPKIREMLNLMLGGNIPKSVQDVADNVIPFLNRTFGLEIETEFPEPNMARCKMKNCINRPLAEQSLAQGNEGCPLCLGAFMASLTLSAFDVAEIDQFYGKANSDHCVFEIKFQK